MNDIHSLAQGKYPWGIIKRLIKQQIRTIGYPKVVGFHFIREIFAPTYFK